MLRSFPTDQQRASLSFKLSLALRGRIDGGREKKGSSHRIGDVQRIPIRFSGVPPPPLRRLFCLLQETGFVVQFVPSCRKTAVTQIPHLLQHEFFIRGDPAEGRRRRSPGPWIRASECLVSRRRAPPPIARSVGALAKASWRPHHPGGSHVA